MRWRTLSRRQAGGDVATRTRTRPESGGGLSTRSGLTLNGKPWEYITASTIPTIGSVRMVDAGSDNYLYKNW